MHHRTKVRLFAFSALAFFISAGAAAQDLKNLVMLYLPDISASGGVSLIPYDNWISGNFNQFMSVVNPTSPGELEKLVDIDMDTTATTIYEGDLLFRRVGLALGFKVDVGDNLIGRLNRVMGYLGYRAFSVRYQASRLRGTLGWNGPAVSGMPASADFNNRFVTADLLYYPKSQGSDFYFGLGYMSYELPTQIGCLVLSGTTGEIIYGQDVYQPDMRFRTYSFLFGMDTLQSAFLGVPSLMNTGDGFGFWAATQDRFGGGMARISEEAETWIETANPGRFLRDNDQIIMMVDYNLTLGLRWTGDLGAIRLGMGLGYNVGGQVIMAMSSSWGPITRSDQVDASPNLYLAHHGAILKLTASW
jgi:hypothetical protein